MDKLTNISHIYLTGGGLKGLCYLGIIRYLVLENMVQNIKHIVGTSIGAYFALILGLKIPIDSIEEDVGKLVGKLGELLTIDHHNLPNLFNKNGIFMYHEFFVPIIEYMKQEYGVEDMTFVEFAKKTGINLYVNAISLNSSKRITFSTENTPDVSVISAVKASMSLPFLYQPVLINDEHFMDGIISTFELFENVDKNSKLIVLLPQDGKANTMLYPKGQEFSFLEYFIRVNEIMVDMIQNNPNNGDEVFKIKDLAYDKFLKFAYTDKSIYVDITKQHMDDMIVQVFVEFSIYMKNRFRGTEECEPV